MHQSQLLDQTSLLVMKYRDIVYFLNNKPQDLAKSLLLSSKYLPSHISCQSV
jgi:hypothetical protein